MTGPPPTVSAEERDAAIAEHLAAGRPVVLLPDGMDPELAKLAVAFRLFGLDRPADPVVVVITGVVD